MLQISGSLPEPSVRLLHTNGMKGRYIVLSHCWGPVNKQPLKTTQENLREHHEKIPFLELPKTFQDTVLLSKGIGIEYVWIDSLCIIQHDKEDWELGGNKMNFVYRNATIVISASGARHSSEGLFYNERPQSNNIRLPYIINGVVHGSFHMAPVPPKRTHSYISDGPLTDRAWVLQEWYLSVRLLFFTRNQIFWKCKELELGETGSRENLGLSEKNSWAELLISYTFKSLTYPSDRLYALRGIVSDMQETTRRDKFHFEYGVWQEGLTDDLLWWKTEDPT